MSQIRFQASGLKVHQAADVIDSQITLEADEP